MGRRASAHKHSYNANSGVGVIIGLETGKLYIYYIYLSMQQVLQCVFSGSE